MLFYLGKLAQQVFSPAAAAALLVAAGLAVSLRRSWLGRGLSAAGLALLWGLGSPFVAERLAGPLERAAARPPPTLRAEAAIVLGGTVDLARSTLEHIELYGRTERIIEGAKLVKEGRAQWLVVSGGSGDPLHEGAREADFLARFAEECGVPARAILVERDSRTTAENAAFTAKLLKERGIRTTFLVTSALHMRRAAACFRKAGVSFVPYPVDYEATPPARHVGGFLPASWALDLSTVALHEYLGYAAYWVYGSV